jgi:hypothetical protein
VSTSEVATPGTASSTSREAVVQLAAGGAPPFHVLAWRTGKRSATAGNAEESDEPD